MKHFNFPSKCLKYYRDILDKKRIKKYDVGDSQKRDFTLVSTRNYEVACIELFEEVFKEKMSKEFWSWKYAQHGMKWRGVCAVKGGKVVGHYNGIGRNILYFGQHKKAIASGDTMVSPKARGGIKQNSPFYTMVKIWVEMNLGYNQEFLLSFGFPNKRVMALSKAVGLYAEVDTITEIHWQTTQVNSADTNVEKYLDHVKTDAEILTVWRNMAGDFKDALIGVRNIAYLKHRYINHPKFEYKIYLVYSSEKNLQGVFVLKQENKVALLMDVITQKENFSLIVSEALKKAHKNKSDTMKCWITTSKAKFLDCHSATLNKIDVAIPTSNFTPGFDPETIRNKWFLMYGDTDFI